jgi:DNA (cytosine-5)-methyltransferase 1
MDTTQLTHISLCSGYGGIDLGIRRVLPGLRTVAYSEIEEFACGLLASRMESGHLDPAPIWTDVKTFPWAEFRGKVDILSGGYPCQPFSAAGLRKGADDPRHLWPAIADGISILQPALCFFENVEGHISLGLSTVVSDLEGLGYKVAWGLFSAAEVDAPHQRKRIFILAHKQNQGSQGWLQRWTDSQREGVDGHAGCCSSSGGVWPSRPGQLQHGWEPPRVVGNSDCWRLPSRIDAGSSRETDGGRQGDVEQTDGSVANARSIDGQWRGARIGRGKRGQSDVAAVQFTANGYGQTQPSLGGNADGSAGGMDYAELCVSGDNRTDELRLLGNGVVPATAAIAFTTLMQEMFP